MGERRAFDGDTRLSGAYGAIVQYAELITRTLNLSDKEATAVLGEVFATRLGAHIAERKPGDPERHGAAASAIVMRAFDRVGALIDGPPLDTREPQHAAFDHLDGIIGGYRAVVTSLTDCRAAMRAGDQRAAAEAMEEAHAGIVTAQTQIVLAEKPMIEWAEAHGG